MSASPAKKSTGADEYGAESIKMLKGLDAVRKRPGMYIGDTDDGSGLHHLVYEVVDNAVDEVARRPRQGILVTLNPDGSCTVRDDGRGIPTGIKNDDDHDPKRSAAEIVLTELHAGGKFDQNAYKVSGGLHGVGVSVVNALSSWLRARIWREGKEHVIEFRDGVPVAPLEGRRRRQGPDAARKCRSCPTTEIFTQTEFHFDHPRAPPARACIPQLRRQDRADGRSATPTCATRICFTTAASAFVRYLDRSKQSLHPRSDHASRRARGRHHRGRRMQWNDSYNENVLLLYQQHPAARRRHASLRLPRGADTRHQQVRRAKTGLRRRRRSTLTGDDVREGLTCVLSVKVPDPKFSSQTKDKLVSSEVQPVVEGIIGEQLSALARGTPKRSQAHRRQDRRGCARARGRAQGARADAAQGRARQPAACPASLADCQERDPAQQRALHRRGRLGRRLRQAGPRARVPGDPAAPRQDPQRGEGAPRQDAVVRAGDPTLISALGTGIARRLRSVESCATTRSSS